MGVDPTGLEPVILLAKGNMFTKLTLQTQTHTQHYYNKKLLDNPTAFCLASKFVHSIKFGRYLI